MIIMKSIEYWKQKGFVFDVYFKHEYEFWINPETLQTLRRYNDGRELLSNIKTGKYELVDLD